MWLIDEYPNKGRKFVWDIPPIPLIIRLNKIKYMGIAVISGVDKVIKIGAIFCHVDKMRQFFHDRDCMTGGSQKW